MSNNQRGLTAIIKPTHACNLRCTYCYLEETAESGVMTYEVLENALCQVIEYNASSRKSTHFIWHGGEPLLMKIEFFARAYEIQNRYRPSNRITNSIQTNGTLVSPELLEFCKQNNDFRLGFSLDGPSGMHNAARPYRDGRGSFHDILRNIQLSQEQFNRKMGVIVVLTRQNIQNVVELYSFFRERKINIKVNPLIRSGHAAANYDELAITPDEYAMAMIKLFDLWFAEKEYQITIDPFDLIIGNITSGVTFGCNFSGSCRENFISIGPIGDVYPCGRFDGVREYRLGNLNEQNLDVILTSKRYQRLRSRHEHIKVICSPCRYRMICNGGCMHNAYAMSGDVLGKDYYCSGYQKLFDHITQAILDEIKKSA